MDSFSPARTTHSWRLNVSCDPLVLTEEPRPVPKGREVLMKVSHCGVCHSDLHIREGKYNIGGGRSLNLSDRGLKLPLTLGHEILGTVEAVGAGVWAESALACAITARARGRCWFFTSSLLPSSVSPPSRPRPRGASSHRRRCRP